jgi:uridine kinase
VIVVSGTSGAGKSSLVTKTAELLGDAACLHFDDYRSVSVYPQPDLAAWLAAGADPDDWRTPQFAADLRRLRMGEAIALPENKGTVQPRAYVVVEDPFGRARREMAPSIDFVDHIQVPMEVALARKLHMEINWVARETGCQEALDRLDSFLAGYLDGPLREAYLGANRSARRSCDLVLDGLKPPDELAEEVVRRVKAVRL